MMSKHIEHGCTFGVSLLTDFVLIAPSRVQKLFDTFQLSLLSLILPAVQFPSSHLFAARYLFVGLAIYEVMLISAYTSR
jgi:hypothetical protein